MVVEVLKRIIEFGNALLGLHCSSVSSLGTLSGFSSSALCLGCGFRSCGSFSAGIDCLFIGGCNLAIQIPNRLFVIISLLLQRADFTIGLVHLVLHRRNGFADMLFGC